MSHSAENVKGCILWDLLTYIVLQNIKKLETRDSFETIKNFRKKSHIAEKIKRGDLLVPSGFVGYVKNVKNEKGDPLN